MCEKYQDIVNNRGPGLSRAAEMIKGEKRLQTHLLLDLAEALDHEVDVLLAVTGGELGADAVLALGHHGVAEGLRGK